MKILCKIILINTFLLLTIKTIDPKITKQNQLTQEEIDFLNTSYNQIPLKQWHNLLLDSEISQKIQDILSPENNPYCFDLQTRSFLPNCTYDPKVAFNYLLGEPSNTWSNIPNIKQLRELNDLKFIAQILDQDFYVVVYKSGCPPCTLALSFIESQIKELEKKGKKILKISLKDISPELSEELNIIKTPSFFKVNHKYKDYDNAEFNQFVREIPLKNVQSELLDRPITALPTQNTIYSNNFWIQRLGNLIKYYKKEQNESQNAIKNWHPYQKNWAKKDNTSNFQKELLATNPFL